MLKSHPGFQKKFKGKERDAMKKMICVLLCVVLMLSLACPTLAANQPAEVETAAEYLRELGILVGDETGNLNLDAPLTRAQLAILLTRITVTEQHLEYEQDLYTRMCTFPDVPAWAQVHVGYLAFNHMMIGYPDGTFGASDPVTPAAACTVALRHLGDLVEDDWDYASACETAVNLGIAPAELAPKASVTRGDMAVLLYRTLQQSGELPEAPAAGLSYNEDGSINVPGDGSRYVPKEGDVIRCDDGTNYTITDVSRYDASLFADGPLPPLPEPTCDWSHFPALELPTAEARHFTSGSRSYLFVRNLYETRRMLYTAYNAIGANLSLWEDGHPRVSIQLTVDCENYASFWPWREEEISKQFAGSPVSHYQFEAWDVYADGVFLYTEYMVAV